jgi:hypothetical protein
MNATAAPKRTPSFSLILSRETSTLEIHLTVGQHAHAAIYTLAPATGRKPRFPVAPKCSRLVFAMAHFNCSEKIDLRFAYGDISFWVGGASFDVSADEARRIEETFGPHGLIVTRLEKTPCQTA